MATEKLNEQEIQLRKRARRRLVGAIALVLLMVTVLPMVLDDREAQSPQPEIAVSIPSQDNGDFASRIVPVEPPPAAAPQPAMPPAATPENPQPQPGKVPEPEAVPEPAKAEPETAEQAAAELPAKPAAPEKSTDGKEAFSVQIGVYSDAAKVKQLRAKLAADGFKSYTEKVNTPQGTKTRLRIGPYAARTDAEKARDKLKAAGMAGIVVPSK